MNIGTIKMSGRNAPFYLHGAEVWLICDGNTFANALFPALAALLGVTYGAAPPGNTRLPDYNGNIPVGTSPAGYALGNTAGVAAHSHFYPPGSLLAHVPPNLVTDGNDTQVNVVVPGPDAVMGSPHQHVANPIDDHDISGLPTSQSTDVTPVAAVGFYIRAL